MEDSFQKLWAKMQRNKVEMRYVVEGVLLQSLLRFFREGRTYMWAKPTYTTTLRFVSTLPERSYADSTISWRATWSVLRYAKLLCGQHSYTDGGLADSYMEIVRIERKK